MIRVVIADDHPLVRDGMKYLLSDCNDIELSAEVDNGNSLLEMIRSREFDVVLMDMIMPGRNGIELLKLIKHEFPKIPVLVLSTHKEDIYAVRAIKAGASGYLCKDYAGSSLVDAIRKVAAGGRYITPVVAELMATEINSTRQEALPHTLLSDREYQVFMLTLSGKGSMEVANELNLSIKTVTTHKARIKSKLKLSSATEMLTYAINNGLFPKQGGENQA